MMQNPLSVLFLVLGLCWAVSASCPEPEMIQCRVNDRCTRIRYICDGDNDCGDYSDEHDSICNAWHQPDCSRGQAMCHRYGSSDCVSMSRYCTLSDPPCEGDVDDRICQMVRDEQLDDLNNIVVSPPEGVITEVDKTQLELTEELGVEFEAQVEGTLKHADCPNMYTKVADKCISFFFPGNITWGEARAFCHSMEGELLTFEESYEFYATIVSHISEHHITQDFWVGGSKSNDTLPWVWVNDSPIEIGSPYWAIRTEETCTTRPIESLVGNITRLANQGRCYHYSQAPSVPPHGYCTALTYEKYHYMSDENCLSNKAPLCVHN